MSILAECPVHELTAGLGGGDDFVAKRELKALLQPSRNWPLHQSGAYAHLNCNLRIKHNATYLLLGKNGVGKSTLLKAIARRDNGLEDFPKDVTTFLLDQEVSFLQEAIANGKSVIETVLDHANQNLARLMEEAERLENGESLSDEEVCERLCEIYDQLEEREAEAKDREQQAMLLLKGLGFKSGREEAKVASLSGGWRSRVGLACALSRQPDLLLLDEPTNHLDINTIVWLQRYLSKKYKGKAVLICTHDREFAEKVCTDIIVFANQKLQYFNNMTLNEYEQVVQQEGVKMENLMQNLEKKKEALRKQKLALSKAAHAGDEKAGKAVAKLTKKLGRTGLEKTADGRKFNSQKDGLRIGADNNNCGGWKNGRMTAAQIQTKSDQQLGFGFKQGKGDTNSSAGNIFELQNPRYRYPGASKDAVRCGEFPISMNCRIAICGGNGEGKTTLLKMLTGELSPTSGEVRKGPYRIMHLSQSAHDDLAEDPRSPLQRVLDSKSGLRDHDVRQHLARFGVRGDQALRPMTELSGGQRVRVAMALGALGDPCLLLFDEPTNHLDMGSIDELGKVLRQFEGGVILCTHDRSLIKKVANEVLLVKNGVASMFEGTPLEYVSGLRARIR